MTTSLPFSTVLEDGSVGLIMSRDEADAVQFLLGLCRRQPDKYIHGHKSIPTHDLYLALREALGGNTSGGKGIKAYESGTNELPGLSIAIVRTK